MAKGVTIGVTGLSALKKKLGSIPRQVIEAVDSELGEAAFDFESRAVQAAPKDEGFLAQGISVIRNGEMHYEVVSAAPQSVWMEFGTRSRVKVPTDLQQYAAQFRGKKSSGDAKKAVFEWCRRHGIPEDAWFPIFIKIMTVGIKPKPFFFIQRVPVQQELQKRLTPAIKKALK